MKLKSISNNLYGAKHPVLRKVFLYLSNLFTFFYFTTVSLVFIMSLMPGNNNFAWLLPFFMIILLCVVINYNLKTGGWRVPLQVIELKSDYLFVTHKWLIFHNTKQFKLYNLSLEIVTSWNIFTGKEITSTEKYARLVINNEKTFPHIYKLKELENFISEYKIRPNETFE